jgi:hypothetical protein
MEATFTAKEFFQQIINSPDGSFNFLERLAQPASNTEENEWMDFKGAAEITAHYHPSAPSHKELDKENDKKILSIWSEYLGAFSNSGGGLLVWGIDAPGKTVVGSSLVKDAKRLRDRLLSTALEVVDPPVQNCKVEAMLKPGSAEGFVVCLIPPSKFAPHRSKKAAREYYIRSQDSNINCQAAVLRRLFYPVTSPRLVPTLELWLGRDKRTQCLQVRGNVNISNKGNSTATDVFVKVKALFNNLGLKSANWDLVAGRANEYFATRPIHPGLEVEFFVDTILADDIQHWPQEHESITAEIAIYARDTDPITWNFSTTHTQVIENERFHSTKLTVQGVQAS